MSAPPTKSTASWPSTDSGWLRLRRSVLHLFKFFAAREDFTALVERASKPATPTFLSALRAAHPFWLRLRRPVGRPILAAAAFRRLLRAARESPTESRTPRTPVPDPSGRLPYETSLPLPPRPQSPPARLPPPATHTPAQSCFLRGESPPLEVSPHRWPPSPRAARCATALRDTIRAGRASGPRRPGRPCATWRASASSDGCHRARTTRDPAATRPAGSPHPRSQAAAGRAASRRRPMGCCEDRSEARRGGE